MALTKVEKERVTDSRLKLQAVSRSLREVDPSRIPDFEDIESCLESADKSLQEALWNARSSTPHKKT